MAKEKKEVFKKYKKLLTEAFEDLKTPGRRHRQIPNILTTLRLLAPAAILPAAAVGNLPLTIGMIAAFSLTDWVDGFIARHWNLTSELGKDLDAVTDKIFAATLLIAASFTNPILLTNLVLEGVIAGINTHQELSGMKTSSSYIGKIKTWALFSLAGLGIVSTQLAIPGLLPTLAIGTAAMQGLTIASYLSKYNEQPIEDTKKHPTPEIVKRIIEEQQMLPLDKTKTKEIVESAPIELLTEEEKKQQRLENLRELSDFFHQEQQNQNPDENTTPKIYQKQERIKEDE